jgi:hypothetical protein
MILLSEAIFKIGCRAAEMERPDFMLSLGLMLATQDHGQGDPEDAAAIVSQAKTFKSKHLKYLPKAPGSADTVSEVLNDLYRPNTELDDDGLLHIRFPVPEREPLTSELLGLDWRVAGLAWFELRAQKSAVDRVVIEALRPVGLTVYSMLRMDVVTAFEQFLGILGIQEMRESRVPNASCVQCALRETCKPWKSFLDSMVPLQIKSLSEDTRARRLLAERVDLDIRLDYLESQRKEVDAAFRGLASEGRISLGGDMGIDLPKVGGRRWDFKRTHNILSNAGLLDQNLFEVSDKKLEARLQDLPMPVRARLEQVAAIPYTTDFSVKEAIRHASRTGAVQNSILGRGVTGRKGPV